MVQDEPTTVSLYFDWEQAKHLPGPEILGTFDPRSRLFPGSTHTALAPDQPVVLRWYPPIEDGIRRDVIQQRGPLTTETLLNLGREAMEHFQLLVNEGIPVIPHRSFVGPSPEDPNLLALYSASPYLYSAGRMSDTVARSTIGGLTRYVQYVQRELKRNTNIILNDLCSPAQFFPHGTVRDIDPSFALTRGGQGQSELIPIAAAITRLQGWATDAHASPAQQAEIQKLTELL